ncbi:hypothetical protein OG234_13415 [Streptomyces sp. NBC_01420]|uniref:hypothetical protein n=1 Tax=Streptomyces sp. NBC_01420 TaxID=2903858 RepID=UPI00324C09FA
MSRPAVTARVHEGLATAAHRLTAGHAALIGGLIGRPVWWPKKKRRGAPAKETPEEQPESEVPDPEEEAEPAPKAKAKGKGKGKKEPAADGEKGGKKDGKKKAPPVHTTYRPGLRRALAAALHWTGSGEGFRDFLIRAGLLAAGLGVLAYFTRPLLAALHPAALWSIAAVLVVYEIWPRLALLLALGLTAALISWVWLCVGVVLLLAVELAPALAALLALGLGAAAVHPAIMWPATLVWTIAAWRAGAPEEAEEVVEAADDVEDEVTGEDWGRALLWHVVEAVATAQTAGRAGIHLDTILDSALTAGLLPEGTDQPTFRRWVEACGLPTEDKIGMRIAGKPVTRVGLRISAVTEALGVPPAELLRARSQTPPPGASTTPGRPAGEEVPEAPAQTPVQAPAASPSPAPLRLIPGGRQTPVSSPSPAPAPEVAQGAR